MGSIIISSGAIRKSDNRLIATIDVDHSGRFESGSQVITSPVVKAIKTDWRVGMGATILTENGTIYILMGDDLQSLNK